MKQYYDKNGVEITEGNILRHDNGEEEMVYACGEDDLGFLATNPRFLDYHPDWPTEYYPLSQFNLKEWTVQKERKDDSQS